MWLKECSYGAIIYNLPLEWQNDELPVRAYNTTLTSVCLWIFWVAIVQQTAIYSLSCPHHLLCECKAVPACVVVLVSIKCGSNKWNNSRLIIKISNYIRQLTEIEQNWPAQRSPAGGNATNGFNIAGDGSCGREIS